MGGRAGTGGRHARIGGRTAIQGRAARRHARIGGRHALARSEVRRFGDALSPPVREAPL